MHKSFTYFLTTILIIYGVYFYITGQINAFSKEIETVASRQQYYNPKTFKNKVIITSPKQNTLIENPVTISGSVSGTWFFEGQIISKIVDRDGRILGQGPLVATDDWMTVESVGFSGIIPFTPPHSKSGFVIIEADNPSGSTNPPSFKIPVMFSEVGQSACGGDDCGECTIGSIGSNGVCVHNNSQKS